MGLSGVKQITVSFDPGIYVKRISSQILQRPGEFPAVKRVCISVHSARCIPYRFVSVAVLTCGFQTACQLVKHGHLFFCQFSEVSVFKLIRFIDNLCNLVLDFCLGIGTDVHSFNLSQIRK